MRQSQLLSRTQKEAPKDEVSLNAQLLIRAGYIEKVMAGVYTMLPLGLRVLRNIEHHVRTSMQGLGAQEILMSSLQPKQNWEMTGRYYTYDSLFRFTSHYSKTEYVLGPTHEEMVSPLVAKFASSYKHLPRAVFQIQTKFRDEKRSKSGLLRGREFIMKDLYSFHASSDDLDRYYTTVSDTYQTLFETLGIGETTYLTYASGGTFAKYSHEFQTLTDAGEDIIYLCIACRVAINKEIIDDQSTCPQCNSSELKEEKAVEVGNIFKLLTRYSEPFHLTYRNAEDREMPVIMGCYGIGLGRLMGTIVEVHHDDKGIIWPETVAPFKVHLLALPASTDEMKSSVTAHSEALYAALQAKGIEVLYDDREELSAGEKLKDSDLLGIPWRFVVSEKSLAKGGIEIKKRNETESRHIGSDEWEALIP